MEYPNIGDTFYWEDLDGNIHENTCYDIDKDPNGNVVTNYFIHINENGGGAFVDEDSIVDPNSDKVKKFIKQKRKDENEKYWNEDRKKKMIDFMWLNIADRDVNRKAVIDMFESLLNSDL